ncbi:MAG TPA: undecaprenyl-diphosphate phosphatase [Myxococcota bacterium]|jgi:undecaprenyl-diphosphatase|nr:undecaprenyl-diphosphate phosphatase [Myxococcota bacterium]
MDALGYGRAALLGAVQGITEFLPISSDGHLIVTERLLGMSEPTLLLNVVLHGGTLAAILVFYAKDLWRLLRGVAALPRTGLAGSPEARLVGLLLLACVPTGIIGLTLKDPVELRLSTIYWSGAGFLFTAAALMLTRGAAGFAPEARGEAALRARDALAIGTLQGFAVLPGVSRSALTISCALWLGIAPADAARLSFLLAIPAIAGALLVELRHGLPPAADPGPLLLGAAVAFVTGLVALKILVGMLSRGQFADFARYLVPLALGCLAYGLRTGR